MEPPESIQRTRRLDNKTLTNILQEIQKWKEIPNEWKQGAVVHIYKNIGDVKECENYRPICLTQIAYKIWPIIITRRLAQVLHLLTGPNQFGYKRGVATMGAVKNRTIPKRRRGARKSY